MTESNFTIGFIGLGLIGGSIAKGIRRVFPNYTLIGMDENPDTIKSALKKESLIRLQRTARQILQIATMYFYVRRFNIM